MMQDKELRLRLATLKDADLLFCWANESIIRKMAFDSSVIVYEEHLNWFKKKLISIDSLIYIAELDDKVAIGQVRFDLTDDTDAVIDLHLTKRYRGKGLGGKVLTDAVHKFIIDKKVKIINAYIKRENLASYYTFLKSGFVAVDDEMIDNTPCFHLIMYST